MLATPTLPSAARSARYGEAAAQALDREEAALAAAPRCLPPGAGPARPGSDAAALREQLFTAEEQPRIDAALALRALTAPAAPD